MIFLQHELYLTKELQIKVVDTLLTRQALSWFAPLFEKKSSIFNNLEAFLKAFVKAFGEHDKARWTITKIYSLRRGMHFVFVYSFDFQ